jgi:hypothetical protein
MNESKAKRIAYQIIQGINSAVLPISSLQMTVSQIRTGWSVSLATAQAIQWILTENYK